MFNSSRNDMENFLLLNQIHVKTLNLPRIFKPWIAAATEDQWIVARSRNSSHYKRQRTWRELFFYFVRSSFSQVYFTLSKLMESFCCTSHETTWKECLQLLTMCHNIMWNRFCLLWSICSFCSNTEHQMNPYVKGKWVSTKPQILFILWQFHVIFNSAWQLNRLGEVMHENTFWFPCPTLVK